MKKLLIIFLIIQPFLDISYTLNLYNINSVVRGLFFLIATIYLIKNKKYKEVLFVYIPMIIYVLMYLFYYKYSLFNAFTLAFKFFYLPICMLFFYNYKDKIDNKYLVYTLIFYLLIYYISLIFNIGSDIYERGVKKEGFKGLYNSINELSTIIIILLGISLNYLNNKKKYVISIILLVLSIFLSMTLGTKVILGGIIILILYFMYKPFKEYFNSKNVKGKVFITLSIVVVAFFSAFLITNTTTYKNAEVQKKYFKVKNVFSFNYVNKVIFNNRFSFVPKNHKIYASSNIINKIFGINENIVRKDVEIDLFDVFYKYGLIGFMLIIIYILYILYKSKLKAFYKFLFILLLLISEASGHVLLCPAVSLYFGIIVYYGKRKAW